MIHQYKLNGFNIVLDTYSGSVHCVDDLSYDIIALYNEKKSKDEIKSLMLDKYKKDGISEKDILDTFSEVDQLIESSQLFTDDVFKNANLDLKKRDSVIKAMCLHVAHTCNLNCEYCFAGQGRYHGKDAIMSFEVGKESATVGKIEAIAIWLNSSFTNSKRNDEVI